MNEKTYKVKKAFLVPLAVIVVLLFFLFLVSLVKSENWEKIVIAVLFLFSSAAFVGMGKKKIIVDDQGLKIKNIFRSKEFKWAEITHLAVVVLRKKVYFLLTTTKGFHIFSNLLENHALLIRELADKLGDDKVEAEVRNYLNNPLERLSFIIMSWVAVVIIIAVIILRFSGI